jgi:hypothetical protein
MTTRPTALRTLASVLVVVAGSLTLATGSAPAASAATEACHSVSQGFQSWVSYEATDIACVHAHSIGKKWSSSCGRSSSTVTPMHCTIIEHVDGRDMHFSCANKKASQSPSHYHVHCTHEHRLVTFTYFPHGF